MLAIVKTLLIIFSVSCCVSGDIFYQKGAPHVRLSGGGQLAGSWKSSRDGRPYAAFEGVEYATVRERFATSEITDGNWEGVQSATAMGPICPQREFGTDNFIGAEDCLRLNVYVPSSTFQPSERLPVMVWIHGGGFFCGAGSEYSPKYIMDEDVVFVTINYRLGVFGFLATADNVIPGNNGLKDQVAALMWIQQHIQNFGGNPNLVTIVGESAGSASTHHLLLSPLADGLFHRVISMSGTSLASWAMNPNPWENAVKLATYLKCPTAASDPSQIISEEVVSCFRKLSTYDLNKAQTTFLNTWPNDMVQLFFAPVEEPQLTMASSSIPFLTDFPVAIVQDKNRRLKQIPWMVGVTENEGAFEMVSVAVSSDKLMKDLNDNWNEEAPPAFSYERYFPDKKERDVVSQKMRQFYFGDEKITPNTIEGIINMYSDNWFTYNVQRAALQTAARGEEYPVYLYQYAYYGPHNSIMALPPTKTTKDKDPFSFAEYAAHGDELQHLFDTSIMIPPDTDPGLLKLSAEDEEFSKNFVKLWVSFATHGKPTHSWGTGADKEWTPVSQEEANGTKPPRYFRIDKNPSFVIDPFSERMAFWGKLWIEHFDPALFGTELVVPEEKTEL